MEDLLMNVQIVCGILGVLVMCSSIAMKPKYFKEEDNRIMLGFIIMLIPLIVMAAPFFLCVYGLGWLTNKIIIKIENLYERYKSKTT